MLDLHMKLNLIRLKLNLITRNLGGDYTIPVGRDEILSHFADIPAVLVRLAITCEKCHPGKVESLFCTAGISLCRDEIWAG